MKLTASDLQRLGVADVVVKEPVGGAHRAPMEAIDSLGDAMADALADVERDALDGPALRQRRRERFLKMGG